MNAIISLGRSAMDLKNNRKIVQKEIISELLSNLLSDAISVEHQYFKGAGVKDLSMSEINIINAIAKDENPTMSSIAERLCLTNGTITTSVKKLEKKLYVIRKEDHYDRRYKHVYLTTKGKDIFALHNAFQEEMVSQVCDSPELMKEDHLIDLLSKLSGFVNDIKYKYEVEK